MHDRPLLAAIHTAPELLEVQCGGTLLQLAMMAAMNPHPKQQMPVGQGAGCRKLLLAVLALCHLQDEGMGRICKHEAI